jgi:hypothetical protein
LSEITQVPKLPWQPQSLVRGNLAIGNLANNLPSLLRSDRGVHAETLLVAAGALVGFAAQQAALFKGAEAADQSGIVPKSSIVVIETKSGQKFLFGEWINGYLFPEIQGQLSLFNFAAAKAIQAGISKTDLPSYEGMARHVAESIGSPDFGIVRAPKEHQPQLQPCLLVRGLWGHITKIMELRVPMATSQLEPELSPTHWPMIMSIAFSNFIETTKNVLDPRIGYALMMESAIIAAKIFPEAILPRMWRIEPKNGALSVLRLNA